MDNSFDQNEIQKKSGPFTALTHRNFRLFFIGQFISVAGSWMQIVAQQWLVYALTHSAAWLGVVSGASALPYVLLSLHGGQIADRVPRRLTMVWTQAAAMVLAFVLAWLVSPYSPVHIQPWHIALLAALGGVVNAYAMPTQQAFVTDMVDSRDALRSAIAMNSFQFNVARVLGPVLAGITLAKLGASACFFLNAVSFLAVIASLLMMRLAPFVPSDKTQNVWEGLRYILAHTRLIRVFILVSFASMCVWSVSTLYPVFATSFVPEIYGRALTAAQTRSFSAIVLSHFMTATGAGAAAGGLLVASVADRVSRRLLLYGASAGFGASLLVFALSHSYLPALGLIVLSGICMVVFAVSANTLVQEESPDELRGRIMAAYALIFGGLMPLGGLEIGFLAQHMHAMPAVIINVILFLAVDMGAFLWLLYETRTRGAD